MHISYITERKERIYNIFKRDNKYKEYNKDIKYNI